MSQTTIVDSTLKASSRVIKNVVIAGTPIYRVVANGHIVFDRKDYTLLRNSNYTYSAAVTGGTVSFPSTAITSTYNGYNASGTRVNGASAGYAVSPASLSSNAHNTTSRSGNLTVSQDNSGLEITIPYNQSPDSYEDVNVCTGLTVTLSNVAVIPASGGSVGSSDVTVVANGYVRHDWQSGDSTTGSTTSWTLTSSDYTLSWTGVTASSKGEVTSNQTTAGTLYCKATFRENTSITGQGSTTVYQEANLRTGWTSWDYIMSLSTNVSGTYTSAGGNVTVYYGSQRRRLPIYTSKATGSTYSYQDITSDLTTNVGSLASSEVTGDGTTTLTVPANTLRQRTITLTLKYQEDNSKSATTSFSQYASSSSFAYAYLSNYTGNGQLTTWNQIRDIVKEINADSWTTPTTNVYRIDADGSVTYRIGTSAASQLVPADTYFYNVDNLLFNTRNVTTAGAEGTEHLYYKRNGFTVNAPSSIDATATTFTITGSTNTDYGVTVKRGTTTVTAVTHFTGSLVVNCGENTSTSSTRTFTVTFTENNPSAGNKPTMSSLSVVQAKAVSKSIDIDVDEWEYCSSDMLNTFNVIVSTVGGGWTAQYNSSYFSVTPASGPEGTTTAIITALNRGTDGTYQDIYFLHDDLTVGRKRLRVWYLDC